MNLRRWGALGTAAVSLAGAMVVTGGATAAHADTRCDWNWIQINSGKGAEPKSVDRGHSHNTGNHYVQDFVKINSYERRYTWVWYADNNGGSDGDTTDTFYGYSYCPKPAW
ncbi:MULTISPECIES: hypothetical protein [Streptosporangium]|uniref:Secreted protein n=1 Tax=Streptosporangium roseum (strain ATCC 12428 / DSM 43021 / JCM 3005 / KCTC 9067 / NCIMB 10171 / NRRL 2505 / NI 9100) TaxID=479432 RepID=D2BC58_STRRD|nr:hypothetical protein [Streptosporangium roseum]ACZ88081.1 hypothetical protein Sros_5315 [Streptosporangium roseum DSM 43021]